jgi:hypothetical protein
MMATALPAVRFRPAPPTWRRSRKALVSWALLQVLDLIDGSAPVCAHADARDRDEVLKASRVSTARGRRIAAIAAAPLIQAQLVEDQQVAARALVASGGDPGAVDAALAAQETAWEPVLRVVYIEAGIPAARRVATAIERVTKGARVAAYKAVILGPEDAPWLKSIIDWLLTNSSEKIRNVLETTRDRVRQQLAEGAELGENIRQLRDRIVAADSTAFGRERAEVIARTEALTAYSVGSHAAADESGVEMDKIWSTSMDGRQRPTHGRANGQRRALKEPYTVGGADLMFPSDSSLGAPASETIQCRCSELYVPV